MTPSADSEPEGSSDTGSPNQSDPDKKPSPPTPSKPKKQILNTRNYTGDRPQSEEEEEEEESKPLKKKKDSDSKIPAKGNVIIKFEEGNIKELINEFSELLGKNFTYDDSIRGNITIIGPSEVSKWEARKIFEAALERMGYAVVWGWPINKIIPVSRAKSSGNVPVFD
jgi:hypothetical protein